MISWTLLIFVLNSGSVNMPGFASQEACEKGAASIIRSLEPQLRSAGAADFIAYTCVRIQK